MEIEALWYNAVSYTLALARKMKDKEFTERWGDMPARTKDSFLSKFMLDEGYPADFVNDYEVNTFRRSNMLVACALDYTMLGEEQIMDVLNVVRQHLLTRRGIRSLSPRNPFYEPSYAEDQRSQDLACHNGSTWIWPLMLYVKTCFGIAGRAFLARSRRVAGGLRRRDTDRLHRFGERVFRGRSSVPRARMPVAGYRRGRTALYRSSDRGVAREERKEGRQGGENGQENRAEKEQIGRPAPRNVK